MTFAPTVGTFTLAQVRAKQRIVKLTGEQVFTFLAMQLPQIRQANLEMFNDY